MDKIKVLEKDEIGINKPIIPVDDENIKIRHESQIRYKKGESERITSIIVMMLSSNKLPYYAEFLTFINYFETTNLPTLGVNINKHGMNMFWNRKFISTLLDSELLFILIHECFHLLFDHTKRSIFYNKQLSNIAQDMIINTIIVEDIVNILNKKLGKTDIVTLPKYHDEYFKDKDGNDRLDKNGNKIKNPYYNKNMGLYIPKEYTGEPIFENLYEWIKDQYENYKNRKEQLKDSDEDGDTPRKGKGKGKGQGKGKTSSEQSGEPQENDEQDEQQSDELTDSFGNPAYGPNGQPDVDCGSLDKIFDSYDKGEQLTLDSHLDDEVSEDARKSIVGDFMQRLKNRGLESGDIEQTLNKLRKTKKNYLKEIKRVASNHILGTTKMKSITRPNRRGIEGIKGKKKHRNCINCIFDTSGSMTGSYEKVLSYIFQNDIQINLISIDTVVKGIDIIKNKRELQALNIKGGGGTILQPSIDYISDVSNKLNKFNNLCLTDGYTDTLDFTNVRGTTLILTTGIAPQIIDPKRSVKIIVIDKENSLYD